MNTDEEGLVTSKRFRSLRFVGWWFLVLGFIMLMHPLAVLFDADATMNVNGLPRKELSVKLAVAAFVSIAPILGAVIVFTPKKMMTRWLLAFEGWAREFVIQRLNGK